jgi:hypothetical protein
LDKREEAKRLSEELLEDIELRRIDDYAIILKSLRMARLLSDTESIDWLQYELSGYPKNDKGIFHDAFQIACRHGRKYIKKETEHIFVELASELSSKIEVNKMAINNFSTAGYSISGELAVLTTNNFLHNINTATNNLKNGIATYERNLSILRGQYYSYALKTNIELSFSDKVSEIFALYKQEVDSKILNLPENTIKKFKVIQDNINTENSEKLSQVLTTCRRLLKEFSDNLFEKYFPKYNKEKFTTKSGKEILVDGDHYLNRLSAVIEKIEDKSTRKTLIGSNVIHTIDWIENLSDMQCKGTHEVVTKDEALRCILHTYLCLGDVLKADSISSES